jgi:hypothetical protein
LKFENTPSTTFVDTSPRAYSFIGRQSTWQGRVNQDGKGSRGIWIMPLMIVAGKRYVEG